MQPENGYIKGINDDDYDFCYDDFSLECEYYFEYLKQKRLELIFEEWEIEQQEQSGGEFVNNYKAPPLMR